MEMLKGLKRCCKPEGIDYQETFSPVVEMKTVRSVLALVVIKVGIYPQQMYLMFFLQGEWFDEIYVQLPQSWGEYNV